MNFLQQLFAFIGSIFRRKPKETWFFRVRFVNSYNAWIIELRERTIAGWLPVGERRHDADHELMAVKFPTRSAAIAYVTETGLNAAYQEFTTLATGIFKIQWQYRIRLDIDANAWVLETKETEDKGWMPITEYVNVRRVGTAAHYVSVPRHFDSYVEAKRCAQANLGLDASYKEVRFNQTAQVDLLLPGVDAEAITHNNSMASHLGHPSSVRPLASRH